MIKKQDVGRDRGVGCENTVRHADHGVQIELFEQLRFDGDLGVVRPEQEAVRQNHRCPSGLLHSIHDDGHKQVRSLTAGKVGGKVCLDLILFAAAVGRIHQNHIKAVFIGIIQNFFQQGVIMINTGRVDVVKQHVGHTQHIGELFFLNTVNGSVELFVVSGVFYFRFQLLQPAGQESAGTAGKIRALLSDFRTNHFRHEACHRAGRIKFSR